MNRTRFSNGSTLDTLVHCDFVVTGKPINRFPVAGVRVRRPGRRGAVVRVRFRDTAHGHTRRVRVASLLQFRQSVVPERRVLAVRLRQGRVAVLGRRVLSLQKPDQVSQGNAVPGREHLSRILLHMLLFPVHVRADHNGHMV